MLVIIEKDITKEEAEDIEQEMLAFYGYEPHAVDCGDGKYMVVGTKEERECYLEEIKC